MFEVQLLSHRLSVLRVVRRSKFYALPAEALAKAGSVFEVQFL